MRDVNPAVVSSSARKKWKELFCNSEEYASCSSKICLAWSSGYNSADDSLLNKRRETDQSNFFLWMHHYCERLDSGVTDELQVLQRNGVCMSCVGRLIYQYLRVEYMAPYLTDQHDCERLRQAVNFPLNLAKVKGRFENYRKHGFLNWATCKVAHELKIQCGRPCYESLAVLLQHGRSFHCPLKGGVFPDYQFDRIKTEYSADMLRMRANRANPLNAFAMVFDNLSFEAMWNTVQYM